MEKLLISACLLGDKCRYDGKGNYVPEVELLKEHFELVPFCPEVEGGLHTPRKKCERRGDFTVVNEENKDVTRPFRLGAEKALNICKFLKIRYAVLKEKSPSCGVHQIYDGTFRNKLIKGEGFTTSLLRSNNIKCYSENEIHELIESLKPIEEVLENGITTSKRD